MNDTRERQYLEDVPRDVQDLIYQDRCREAAQLLIEQKGLGKIQAAMETGRIVSRMSEQFPEAMPAPSSRPALTAKQESKATWGFISLFLVVGTVFTAFGIHGLALGFESRTWPSTEARILQSVVERETSGSGTDRITSYHAKVTYEFTVDGVTYKGDRVASTDVSRGKSAHARRIVKRYPKGSSARVYYMPDKPGKCLLEPGFRGVTFIFLSVGLCVLALGIVFLVAQISVMRDERRAAEQSLAGDVLKAAPEE